MKKPLRSCLSQGPDRCVKKGANVTTPISYSVTHDSPSGQPLADQMVDLYANSYANTPSRQLTLTEALDAIRIGRYRSAVMRVRGVRQQRGAEAYRRAKEKLPAFTFCGTFRPSRAADHLHQHTGIVHFDLDHLTDVQAAK